MKFDLEGYFAELDKWIEKFEMPGDLLVTGAQIGLKKARAWAEDYCEEEE